ncbi:hypothetical protein B0H16DRAFT_1400580 [Mycena metata]|uniref:Proteophosphoglycan ppg4 n=1 Tax=Mycena metata TaxID=1033252 RepID=A0AAD7KIC9_9AGAR|nr:hypothetical protein B0H16DRAFT_1400580 [Mycena metata]
MSSPALVGGISLRAYDLPAASVFAAAYGLLVPLLVLRIAQGRSRTSVLFNTISFAIERVIVFSLRASVAARPNTESLGFSEYMQATFALGFFTLAHIVGVLIRAVLINSTTGSESSMDVAVPPLVSSPGSLWKSSAPPQSFTTEDDPKRRFWFRRWHEYILLLYVSGMVLAIVATAHIYAANDSTPNHRDQALRYASSAIGLVLVLSQMVMLLWARHNGPRINQRAVQFLLVACTLLTIPPIYRLIVMRSTTSNLATPDHQALNTRADKATFYVFHLLPEWIVVAMLCSFNLREICQIGFKGDSKWRDETPEEKAKREKKKQERAMKKAERLELKSARSVSGSVTTLA